jgi:hypothetical protein
MTHPLVSKKRAKALASALFLIGLAILAFTGFWWPAIMLVIGVPLALRQYLLGRSGDALLTLIISGGVFITYQFDLSWDILLPILFSLGAIFILFREFVEAKEVPLEEQEEDINCEIEEEKKR